LHYNTLSLDFLSPPDAMPSDRPNLTLDEQSFQGLLSAAFTIQEHNDRLKQARQTQAEPELHPEPEAHGVCPHCGALKPADRSRCESCGLEEFRPGERLQHNWASMWLMSQEQGLWPERSAELPIAAQHEAAQKRDLPTRDLAASGILALPIAREDAAREAIAPEKPETIHQARGESARGKTVRRGSALGKSALGDCIVDRAAESDWIPESLKDEFPADQESEDFPPAPFAPDDSERTVHPSQLSADEDSSPAEAITGASDSAPSSLHQRLANVRVTLRFHRADLYLGAAVFVFALALLWPAAASAPRRGALGPWERALITLGIAEPAAPTIHLQGDPAVNVWVDPHSALYYCPGEELYGKTADGRLATQREAQMDRFEPASRAACE
jgi:hypothetical protein